MVATFLCGTLDYVRPRNITFSMPEALIRDAKVYAAEHGTTINALVRELLAEILLRESRVAAAADRLLAIAERGPYFALDPGSIPRDELHGRS